MQVDADTVSVMGNPKDAICDAVQKYHCQLLVLGSHGRGAVGRYVCVCTMFIFYLSFPMSCDLCY